MRCLYQNAINSVAFVICDAHFAPAECDNIGKEMVACMKEQMTEKETGRCDGSSDEISKEIEAIVRGMSSPKVMHDRLLDYHENDIAAALEDMNPTERQRLYRILNAEEISEVLSYIDEEEIPSYLEEMDMKKKAAVVSEMDADEIADLLRQMDKKNARR